MDSNQETPQEKVKPTQLVAAVLATGGLLSWLYFWALALSSGQWPSPSTCLVMSLSVPYGVYLFYFYAFKGRLPWEKPDGRH